MTKEPTGAGRTWVKFGGITVRRLPKRKTQYHPIIAAILRWLTFGVYPSKPVPSGKAQPFHYWIRFDQWERESRWEYLYIPWTILRFLFWFYVFHLSLRWAKFWKDESLYFDIAWAGRHDDPTPVWCERCLWSGRQRDCSHGYGSDGCGDVEPSEECPRCGNEI